MERKKPADVSEDLWEKFETACDEEGIGYRECDWLPAWVFFEAGINAKEDRRNQR